VAKVAASKINYKVNSVALECQITSISKDVKQEVIKVDGFCSTGPERMVGNYDHGTKLDAFWDGAAGNIDATLFGLIGSAGVPTDFDPTGTVAGADNPHYTTNEVLEDYSIKGSVGQAISCSATLQGNAALTRAVA
jgi:hypothetical protein